MSKRYIDLVADCLNEVEELFPWDLLDWQTSEDENRPQPLVIDVREPAEYAAFHIKGSLNVPRGILESACDFGYEDTVPQLAAAREKPIVIVCKSGNRSVLAAFTMQLMGFQSVSSLKIGIRGWNDFEQDLIDGAGNLVDIDDVDAILGIKPTAEQLGE
jgi:rhodanese-related sulfurtransferase